MKNKERMLFQNNDSGNNFIMGFIITNIVYTIFTLNSMDKNSELGVFVMLTIMLLLLGFLTAIKVRIYSQIWSVIAICMGIFQMTRLFYTSSNLEGGFAIFINITLVISGLLCLCGGLLSIYKAKIRNSLK